MPNPNSLYISRLHARGAAVLLTILAGQASVAEQPPPPEAIEFFEKRVRPILAANCYSCHGPEKQLSSLRLDSRAALVKGGQRGPAVVPGEPMQSLMIQTVLHRGLKMPLGGRLKDSEIAALERWVRMGAPWPGAAHGTASDPDSDQRIATKHWAFQPVREPPVPEVKHPSWSDRPVDRFVLAALEKVGLAPAGSADRGTLARRLSLVLTGLPPRPEEVDLFVLDKSDVAYELFVDRLLTSSHFGEHWARHWMDVMRFGETHGFEWNYEVLGAWHYRDYLIRAFNQDIPYDQLIREHIAGDLLEEPRINGDQGTNESLIGGAFFRFAEMGHDDCVKFREIRTDVVDNQIDTLGKAFQGLTVACARCHDHKLDPIPTQDYYALYGILTSTRQVTRTLDTGANQAQITRRLRELKPLIRHEVAAQWIDQTKEIARYLLAIQTSLKNESDGGDLPPDLDSSRLEHLSQLLIEESDRPDAPLFFWSKIACESGFEPGGLSRAWKETVAFYKKENHSRTDFNLHNYTPFGDFGTGGFAGWHPDGIGISDGISGSGEFAVAREGPGAVAGVFPAGIYSHVFSDRLNGALRSPYLPKDKQFLSLRIMGDQLSARRTIIDNCMLGEHYETIDSEALAWATTPTQHESKELPVYVELVTKYDNPRLPDRPGKMKDITPEQLAAPGSHFGIVKAVLHDIEEPPKEELSHVMRLFEQPAPESLPEMAARYATVCRRALTAWSEGRVTDDDAKWIDWMLRNGLVRNSKDLSPRLSELIEAYRNMEAQLSQPQVVNSMADLDPGYDFPLLKGGNAKGAGDPVPRGFLRILKGGEGGFRTYGSGRRELADLIASPSNPLTARVMVNRVWQHVFGRGIVPTPDDFGCFGEKPSHPELLDYLATRFVADGWSVKKLIRLLVLSETFQQLSHSLQSAEVDPGNRWLHHYPGRRLEAEAIRDSILATSGGLIPNLYGPSIQPHRRVAKDHRKLYSGPLDGNGRRSIYVKVTRMEGAQFLEAFDFPSPSTTRGRRDVTNVPSQALALMNDPFVIGEAGRWSNSLVAHPASSLEDRIDTMFRVALSRAPHAGERKRFRNLCLQLAQLHQVPPRDMLKSEAIWKDMAHTIFNLKEFIYIQ